MLDTLLEYDPDRDVLKNKRILITGCAEGLGRAVALALARYGADLILLDRKQRRLETLYDEIVAERGSEPALLPLDLAALDQDHALRIRSGIEHDFQGLDGLIHNAAHLTELAPLQSVSPEVWRKTFQVNLDAPWLLTSALYPLLRASPHASVLFTSADCGRKGEAYWGPYAAAYGGLEILARTWSDEAEQNTTLRFNTIDPGPLRTAMRRRTFPGEVPDSVRRPEDVTPAYLYLMSDDSRSIRGQMITIPSPPPDST